jgi:tRNA threonylcarbamoyladenosine biosynthesis protein TsaB
MHLLAFDTSTSRCVIGLATPRGRWRFDVEAGNTHSQLLLPQIESMLRDAGLTFSQLDAIAFGSGPGSFTGVRIACACAQGLAFAHDIDLVPVGTLEALFRTYAATSQPKNAVWTVNDARMNELYAARYVCEHGVWREDIAPHVESLNFVETIDFSANALAGDACHAIAALAQFAPHVAAPSLTADGLLDAALSAHASGRRIHPRDAQPLYVRDKVALTEAERARA